MLTVVLWVALCLPDGRCADPWPYRWRGAEGCAAAVALARGPALPRGVVVVGCQVTERRA